MTFCYLPEISRSPGHSNGAQSQRGRQLAADQRVRSHVAVESVDDGVSAPSGLRQHFITDVVMFGFGGEDFAKNLAEHHVADFLLEQPHVRIDADGRK